MPLREDLQAQLDATQRKLNLLNGFPEDTYNLGTVIVMAAGPQGMVKRYFVKVEEETWTDIKTNTQNDLASWIMQAIDAPTGYFEIYKMTPGATPIYSANL
jgi:hypothetical protein